MAPKKKGGKKSQRKLDVEPESKGPEPLPPELEAKCREGFELYDEEHKGEVSFETCRVLLETMGDTMRVEEIKDQFVVIGKDPKEMKGVTLQDFIELVQSLVSVPDEELKPMRAFQLFDEILHGGTAPGVVPIDDCKAFLMRNGTNPLTIDEFDAFVEEIKALEKLQTSDAGPSVAYEDFLAAAMEAAKAKGKKGKKK